MWDVDDGSRRKTKGRLQSLSCEGNKLRKERISPQKLSHKRTIQSAEGEMCLIFSPILSSSIMCERTKGKENRSSRDVKTIEARFARQQLSHFDTRKTFFYYVDNLHRQRDIFRVCNLLNSLAIEPKRTPFVWAWLTRRHNKYVSFCLLRSPGPSPCGLSRHDEDSVSFLFPRERNTSQAWSLKSTLNIIAENPQHTYNCVTSFVLTMRNFQFLLHPEHNSMSAGFTW